jgi:holo-[acyl-carrier protein] synthase
MASRGLLFFRANTGMNIGIDIVYIPRIEKLLRDAEQTGCVFNAEEMAGDAKTMAGRFAAKEAYFKAVGEKRDWTSVLVLRNENEQPYLVCPEGNRAKVSISHDGEYAVAVVLIE